MNYESLLQENKLLRQTCERLQNEKDELVKINENNFSEYNALITKYQNLLDLKNTPVPEIMKREVSE